MEFSNADILRLLYYDMESGFLPAYKLYKKAKVERPTITLKEVQDWLKKQESKQKKGYKFYNSFVNNAPLEEFQLDIADMQFLKGSKKYMLVCIDVFSKYGYAIPLATKTAEECGNAFEIMLNKMGIPKDIYTQTMVRSGRGKFAQIIEKYGIRSIITRTHAAFAERFIRTLKNMLTDRVEFNKNDWVIFLEKVLNQYNNTEHSSHKMKPRDAHDTDDTTSIKINLLLQAQHKRKYPTLDVGDMVRIFKKKDKYGAHKEWVSNWTIEKHKVDKITHEKGQQFYYLENQSRPYLRHELLLIESEF